MRPSSSRSEPPDGRTADVPAPDPAGPGLLGAVLARGQVPAQVDDRAWLRALLDVEAALARASARVGLLSAEQAAAVGAACSDPGAYDVDALGAAAAAAGNPVVPLVRAVEALAGPAAGGAVHSGATSQDVLDTAAVLVARRALAPLLADLAAAAEAAAALAATHRDAVMVARTLLQQAAPTTFGARAATWALALDGAGARLTAVDAALPVQLGGAAGTLAALDGRGLAVLAALAEDLRLAEPVLPWHTVRLPVVDLAGALGAAAAVLGKVALDVVLLASTEVGEVAEGVPGRGGSSAMPHKRNPVAAVSARAAALRAPGLAATLLTCAQLQEHERAAGGWHAEWLPLTDLLRTVGSAAAWLRDCLEHLDVDAGRMRAAFLASGRELVGEAVVGALAPDVGRAAASDVVRRALAGADGDVRAALLGEPAVGRALGADGVDALLRRALDPAAAVGEAGALVDRALAARPGGTARPEGAGLPGRVAPPGPLSGERGDR